MRTRFSLCIFFAFLFTKYAKRGVHLHKQCADSPFVLKACTACQFSHASLQECATDVRIARRGIGIDKCSVLREECVYDPAQTASKTLDDLVDMAYVFSLHQSPALAEKLKTVMRTDKIRVIEAIRGEGNGKLTGGELGYTGSTVKVMEDALKNSYETILVLDDDALLALDFERKIADFLESDSCSCFLESKSDCPPGILMLGATVIGNEEIFDAWDSETFEKKRKCANFIRGAWGSFANIYSTKTFPAIFDWIEKEGDRLPFDAVYASLATQGYVVRVARPFLSMALMNSTSTVQSKKNLGNFRSPQERAEWFYKQNRWDLSDFY